MCTTELSAVAQSSADFESRGVKVHYLCILCSHQIVGLSANDVDSHHGWIKDIDNFTSSNKGSGNVDFPIIADKSRKISALYGMLDNQDKTNVDAKGIPFTVRSVFISELQAEYCSLTCSRPQAGHPSHPYLPRQRRTQLCEFPSTEPN